MKENEEYCDELDLHRSFKKAQLFSGSPDGATVGLTGFSDENSREVRVKEGHRSQITAHSPFEPLGRRCSTSGDDKNRWKRGRRRVFAFGKGQRRWAGTSGSVCAVIAEVGAGWSVAQSGDWGLKGREQRARPSRGRYGSVRPDTGYLTSSPVSVRTASFNGKSDFASSAGAVHGGVK